MTKAKTSLCVALIGIAVCANAIVVVSRPPGEAGGGTYSDNAAGQFIANSFVVPGTNGTVRIKRITLWGKFDNPPTTVAPQNFSFGVLSDVSGLPGARLFSAGYGMFGEALDELTRKYAITLGPSEFILQLGTRYWLNFTGAGGFNFGNKMQWLYGMPPGGVGAISNSQFSNYSLGAPSSSYAFILEGDVMLNGSATISGRIDLQNWAGISSTSVNIEIYQNGSLVQTISNVLVAPNGNYAVTVNRSGEVQLRFVSPGFLARRTGNLTLGFTTVGVNPSLINGDVDGDNEVTLVDFGMLAANFATEGPVGDLDGDGEVNLFDYGIVSANFGLVGDD